MVGKNFNPVYYTLSVEWLGKNSLVKEKKLINESDSWWHKLHCQDNSFKL